MCTNLPFIHFGIDSHHNLVISVCFCRKLHPEILNLTRKANKQTKTLGSTLYSCCNETKMSVKQQGWSLLRHSNIRNKGGFGKKHISRNKLHILPDTQANCSQIVHSTLSIRLMAVFLHLILDTRTIQFWDKNQNSIFWFSFNFFCSVHGG